MRIINLKTSAVILAGAVILAALPAKADLSFDLTADFSSGGNIGTPPFGTVNLHQNGSSVDITVTLNSPFAFNGSGSGFALGFDLAGHPAAGDVSITGVTFNNGTSSFSILKSPVNGLHADGTGNWDYAVDYTASGLSEVPHPTILSFTVTKISGPLSFADFINNPNGNLFISDIGNTTTGVTGDVAVPEPTTMIAGALLLLPFGASTLRVLRNRKS